jgi:hypothetical protein
VGIATSGGEHAGDLARIERASSVALVAAVGTAPVLDATLANYLGLFVPVHEHIPCC